MKLTAKQGATILTVISAIGVVAVAFFSGKETLEAEKALKETKEAKGEDLKPSEVIKTAAPKYIWTGVSVFVTLAASISSDILNKKSIAAATATAAALSAAYEKFRAKAQEEGYLEEIDKALAKDQIEKEKSAYPDPENVDGQICCFRDTYLGRRAYGTMTDYERARKQAIGYYMSNHYFAYEDLFYLIAVNPEAPKDEQKKAYKRIENSCFPTDMTEEIGWSHGYYEQFYEDSSDEPVEGEFDISISKIGNDEFGIPVYNMEYTFNPDFGYMEY